MGSESLQYNFPDNQTIFGERVSAKQFVDDQAMLWGNQNEYCRRLQSIKYHSENKFDMETNNPNSEGFNIIINVLFICANQ